jgi:signal transduction histidine kinase
MGCSPTCHFADIPGHLSSSEFIRGQKRGQFPPQFQTLKSIMPKEPKIENASTELRQARNEAESLRAKYTDLYDFSPVGYFTLSPDGRIRMVNLTGSALVGIQRSRLLGKSFSMRVPSNMRAGFNRILKQVFDGGAEQSVDLKILYKGLPAKEVIIKLRLTPDGGECNVTMAEISGHKLAEDILRRSEALFSALIEQAPVGVYAVDSQLCLLEANPTALPAFGNVHPLIGRSLHEILLLLWPKRIANQVMALFKHTLKTGEFYESPYFVVRRLGSEVKENYEWQIQRITLPNGDHGVVCFFSNITECSNEKSAQLRLDLMAASNMKLKREIMRRMEVEGKLHETQYVQGRLLEHALQQKIELRGMSHQILHSQEDERKRISRELHGVIAQTLVGINVHVTALAQEATDELGSLRQRIADTHRLVGKSVEIVHQFARELRPTILDDLGLIPALRDFLNGFMENTGIRVNLKIASAIEESPESIRTTFYRIIQESLMNVAKHAKASKVEISIRRLADVTSLRITDDGCGFDAEKTIYTHQSNRLGLLGMRERAEMVGGELSVDSAPGKPTTIRVTIKSEPKANHKKSSKKSIKQPPTTIK